MTTLTITGTDFGGHDEMPLLILGPSLGTSAITLWAAAARRLTDRYRVVGWDLPGHGGTPAAAPFTIAELAAAVLALTDQFGPVTSFHYAGDSVGGCVGLQLMLDAPHRISSATLLCTGSSIGNTRDWHERADSVRASGTEPMVASATQRWFGRGFVDRDPDTSAALLAALADTDPQGYAVVCDALADFDVTARLGEIDTPVLCVAGSDDLATPPDSLQRIVSGVRNGRLIVLDGVGHQAPAEAPDRVADLIGRGKPDESHTGQPHR
jgi:3-oxoadipate enol-lactonase / 4-carboxymuconolactone decarboxylase